MLINLKKIRSNTLNMNTLQPLEIFKLRLLEYQLRLLEYFLEYQLRLLEYFTIEKTTLYTCMSFFDYLCIIKTTE